MGLAVILKKLLMGRAFTTERGRIKLFGRMNWTLFPSRALALNLQTIGEKLGEDFVYDLGYQAGKDTAREMIKYPPELQCGSRRSYINPGLRRLF